MKKLALHWKIGIGMVVGVALGFIMVSFSFCLDRMSRQRKSVSVNNLNFPSLLNNFVEPNSHGFFLHLTLFKTNLNLINRLSQK